MIDLVKIIEIIGKAAASGAFYINMLKKLENLAPAEWFKELLTPLASESEPERGNLVSCCVPPVYQSYGKIFHPIFEDLSIEDRNVSWNEVRENTSLPEDKKSETDRKLDEILATSVTVYGGDFDPENLRLIRWKQLADELGLMMHPEFNVDTFTRNFRGRSWPRYLIGPDEGILEGEDCKELVSIIKGYYNSEHCYFLYDLLATNDYENDLLYEGDLEDIFEVRSVENVHASPSTWWPENRQWFVHTDYDLCFTLVGGSAEMIQKLVTNEIIECIEVKPIHRIDYRADRLNP